MFHKTVHKTWNLFKLSEQSLKILQKNPIHDFWLVKNYFRSIECSFQSVEQESSSDQDIQKLQDFYLPFQSIEPKFQPIKNT